MAYESATNDLTLKCLNLINIFVDDLHLNNGLLAWVLSVSIIALMGWAGALITGAALVLVSPRQGMATCVLLAGIHMMLSAALFFYISVITGRPGPGWISQTISMISYASVLLAGAAIVRRRQIRKLLRTA